MKTLKEGHEKIEEICNVLRKETLEPAQSEANRIIRDAEERARQIIKRAEEEGEKHLEHVRGVIERERNVFQTSLSQAAGQSLEKLRQDIESNLFSDELKRVIDEETAKPEIVANLVKAIVGAIEKDGVTADLSAVIPKTVSVDEVNRLLVEGVVQKLKEKSVVVGDFAGGVRVKLHDRKMTIDLSDDALKELIARYARKDFRKILFEAS